MLSPRSFPAACASLDRLPRLSSSVSVLSLTSSTIAVSALSQYIAFCQCKMASGGGGAYSFSLTTFSPSGKLVQIEHALAAVGQGTTSLGIKGKRCLCADIWGLDDELADATNRQ